MMIISDNFKNSQAINNIANDICEVVETKTKSIPYDKTFTGTVMEQLSELSYKISINGSPYTINTKSNLGLVIGQLVNVCVPQNNYSNMFIITEGSSGGGGGNIESVNGNYGPHVYLDTDDISEGANNLYYTESRANSNFVQNIAPVEQTVEILQNDLSALENSAITEILPGDNVAVDRTEGSVTISASGSGGDGSVDSVNGFLPDSSKNVQVSRELSLDEYNALPESEQLNGMEYYIPDLGTESESTLAIATVNNNVVSINSITSRSGVLYDVMFTSPMDYNSLYSYEIDGQLVELLDFSSNTLESGAWVVGVPVTLTRQGDRAFFGTGEPLARGIIDGWESGKFTAPSGFSAHDVTYSYNPSLRQLYIKTNTMTRSSASGGGFTAFNLNEVPGLPMPTTEKRPYNDIIGVMTTNSAAIARGIISTSGVCTVDYLYSSSTASAFRWDGQYVIDSNW